MKLLAGQDGRRDDSNSKVLLEHMQAQIGAGRESVNTKDMETAFVGTKLMSKPTMYAQLKNLEDNKKIVKCGKAEYKLAA